MEIAFDFACKPIFFCGEEFEKPQLYCLVYLELIGCEAGPGSFGWLWMIDILFCEQGSFHTNPVTCGLRNKPPRW